MWRAIATLFGAQDDRPDPGDVPYGTQWHDPATGSTYGSDETTWYLMGTSSAASGSVGPWIYNSLMYDDQADMTLLDGTRTVLPICSPANVECVVVYLSAPVTYGAMSVQLTVNGVPEGDPIVLTEGRCATANLGVYVETCDVIGFEVQASGDIEPSDLDVTVMATFGAPTPPPTDTVAVSHGLVLGHSVTVDVVESTTVAVDHGLVLGHGAQIGVGDLIDVQVSHGLVLGHQVAGEIPTVVEIDHGLVLGHAVSADVELPPDVPSSPFARYRASTTTPGALSSWTDEGTGGNDLAQVTGASQPTAEAAGFNGHPSVLFDGTDDFMQTAIFSEIAQPNTIVWMGEYVTVDAGNNQYLIDGRQSLARNAVLHRGTVSGDPWGIFAVSATIDASDTPVGKEGDDLCIVAIFDDANSEFHVNDGGNLVSGNPGSVGLSAVSVSANQGGSDPANVRVVEVLVYNRALTAQEITDLQAYFTSTYA